MHRIVGERLQTEQSRRRDMGAGPLDAASEQQYVRKLITDALAEHAEEGLRSGLIPLSAEQEHATSEAIYARMYGAGRLQRLLDDSSIENIDINGCDEVWIRRADGSKERGEPVASTDDELVALVQTLAAYAGRSSRPFDAANIELDLRLPDGSRMSAVQEVSGRPAVSIRRHRYDKVTLADLIGNQTLSADVADFLAAAVRAKFNLVIAGGTDAGKTTLLRALAAQIDPDRASRDDRELSRARPAGRLRAPPRLHRAGIPGGELRRPWRGDHGATGASLAPDEPRPCHRR